MNKETKDMNKVWLEKQKEMKASWSAYYIGAAIFAVAVLIFLIYQLL
ncbi:MAG: hypothetical protein HFG16_05880 [Erysipelotrichaceae bacterium]|jgi:hypothetical protein|nr:hypothetical protein [Erysipelotrichaceae bacterium]